ncbi:alpha/beta hydrolase family protein [Sporichthya polymorpha]|uniref:alpha/beta hydrolase family protein n=1 Tax=Sporichthya polymorpha TaxID=35751 RepID=UPI0003810F32|nr:alpha/beta fold hydrolase [Sporichthya polymorpha]
MSRARTTGVGAVLLALSALAACSDDGAQPAGAEAPSASTAPSVVPTASPDAPDGPALPEVTDERSLAAVMREELPASRIRTVAVESRTDAYTRSRVTYRAGDLTISGVLLRPRGEGPFPGVVLNHGYIDPDVYRPGQGLAREQDRLARAGFVVLHTDYRGHAGSDEPVDDFDRESRLGYTRDTIAAVLALEQEPYVDADRMAMLGRSMGGGVTLNALVVRPGLVEAAIIYASVSSLLHENVEHFTRRSRPNQADRIYAEYGTPDEAPEFWAGLSARSHFDRVSDPLLIHHGRVDDTCPYRWATATQRALVDAGADSELLTYDGEGHTFYSRWSESMDRTIAFLRRHLGISPRS